MHPLEPAELLELLPAIVWQGDAPTRRYTWVSPAAAALLGYPATRWLDPDFWLTHLHPDDAAWVREFREEKLAAGLPHACEYRMIAADGRTVWLSDTAWVESEQGRPARMYGVMVDVTARRVVEEEARAARADRDESHAILEAIFRHAPVGLVLFDAEHRIRLINDRLAEINGIPADLTVGARLADILPAIARYVDPIVTSVFESGRPVEGIDIRGETRAATGRTRYWIASYFPIHGEGGSVLAVGGVVVEVTERREAEEALRASEERYRYLYERTPVMMHSIDSAGRLVDVSDAWLARLGYARDEVVGRRSVEFLTPASREYAEKVVLPAYFRTGVVHEVPYQFVRKDGALLDILLSAVAERDAAGRFQRSLAVLVDVTDRKRAEEALRRSEAQLRQAQKIEAIGRLAGGVAHDFNNLLVVILGYAELLLRKIDDPALRTPVEHIARAGERAAALTRQILTFSRQQVVQPRRIDLNDLILDTEKLLRRLLREDIELVTDLQPSLGGVRIDPGQATQVLMNLAVNAGDAMPHGGRLVIETADVTVPGGGECRPGPYVLLTVTDTGVGMDAETQAHIFEPFFTTKQPGEGTGLGLATVYGIVRQRGGCITVYSEPGRGSCFRVYLPHDEEAVEPEEASAPAAAARATGTVLVVEDDDMVRTIVADVLRESGYDALLARDAAEGMRLVAAHDGPIDVVLTDVVMPGTGCAQLVGHVRSLHPEARVLFMSGYAPPGPGGPVIEPEDFLAKPFTMNALLRKLHEAGSD